MDILRVKIDNLSREEIFKKIDIFLRENSFHQIATINPEFILEAQKNEEFRNILNNCNLNIADGVGLKFAFWQQGEKLKERIAGVDLMWEILKIASDREYSVFLVANKDGLSSWEETRDAILKIYPNLEIDGNNIEINRNEVDIGKIYDYKIIFCNFGAPHQEKFLHSLKNQKNAIIRVAMGVGGAFDFITGKIRRAPNFARKLGLEWLFRLIQQPKRIKRMFSAVIIFPIKLIFKFKYNDNQSKTN